MKFPETPVMHKNLCPSISAAFIRSYSRSVLSTKNRVPAICLNVSKGILLFKYLPISPFFLTNNSLFHRERETFPTPQQQDLSYESTTAAQNRTAAYTK
jgi:hypothetical protein